MGCNCGDNEFNIEIENNGSCEPTTPIYNISLGNVGVSGFSPKVNFVNETTSGFQIQTIDINGEELSGVVPKLSYIDSTFLTQADAATTYLTVNGSNAANPITFGNLSISNSFGNATIDAGSNLLNIRGNGIRIGNATSDDVRLQGVAGIVRILTSSGVIIDSAENKNIFLNTSGTGKAYYNNVADPTKELATIGDIPTVGNGTITFTQGGVTKGTFTTNQSGNTTIDLDAGGGGGSVSNPIVFTESSTDGTRTTTGTLTLGLQTTGDINPALKIHYDIVDSGQGGGGSFSWDEYLIDRTLPATNGGLTATTNSSSGRYIRNMSVNVDGSTLQINSSGQLEVKPNTFVQKSGDTMTGALTIALDDELSAITLKDTNLTKGTAPSANNSQSITFKDKDNKNVGMQTLVHVTNGGNYMSMRTYKPDANSSDYADITVGYNSGGTAYASTVTPPANSNSTNIATTAWVRTWGSSKQDTLTAGDAIDITSNVIGVKIDGTSITLNADGELQSSGSVPSVIDGGNA